MKKIVFSLIVGFLFTVTATAQKAIPPGASNFIIELGGLGISPPRTDILKQIAGTKIDRMESGGGPADWVEVDGRVFLRAIWSVEIYKVSPDFNSYDLDQALAAEMQKRLLSEGFRLTPNKFDFHYVRYQKDNTVGSLEVRSFYLNSGNPPLQIEFIFNESYRPNGKTRK